RTCLQLRSSFFILFPIHLGSVIILFFVHNNSHHRFPHSFPTRRSSDLDQVVERIAGHRAVVTNKVVIDEQVMQACPDLQLILIRSEEHTSELQSRENIVCRLLLEKKKQLLSDESAQPVIVLHLCTKP